MQSVQSLDGELRSYTLHGINKVSTEINNSNNNNKKKWLNYQTDSLRCVYVYV